MLVLATLIFLSTTKKPSPLGWVRSIERTQQSKTNVLAMANTNPELQIFGPDRDWTKTTILLGCEQHATQLTQLRLSELFPAKAPVLGAANGSIWLTTKSLNKFGLKILEFVDLTNNQHQTADYWRQSQHDRRFCTVLIVNCLVIALDWVARQRS